MTISSATITAGPYSTNGATTTFPFAFKVADYGEVAAEDQLEVTLVAIATGVQTVLTRGVAAGQYSVTVNPDQDASSGGEIATVSTYASGYYLYVRLAPVYKQATDLENQGAYYANVVEAQFDNTTREILDIYDRVRRAPHVGVQGGPGFDGRIDGVLTPGTVVMINDDGDGFELGVPVSGGTVSPAMLPVVTAPSILDAIEELEISEAWLRQYGAVDGSGTNSTAAVQALFTALGDEDISVGRGETAQYRIDSAVTETRPVTFWGAGMGAGPGEVSNANCTQFLANFTSGDVLKFSGRIGSELRGFQINNNTAGRVSGAGLVIQGTDGVNANSRLTDISTSGQYDGLALRDVAYPIIDGGYDQAFVRSGVRHTNVQAVENSVGVIRDRYIFGDTTAGTTQDSCIYAEAGYFSLERGLALGAKYGFKCVLPAGYSAGNIEIRGHRAEETDVTSWHFEAGAGAALTMLLIDGAEAAHETAHANYRAGVRFVDNTTDWLTIFKITNMRSRPKITRADSAFFEIETGSDGIIEGNITELMSGSSATAYGCRVGAQAKRLAIKNCKWIGFTTPYVFSGTNNVLLEDYGTGLTVAQISALQTGCMEGSRVLVTNGKKGSAPLVTGSDVVIAVLRNDQWECETAAGAFVLLASGTASNQATLDIPFLPATYGTGYRGFVIKVDSLFPATDGAIPYLRVSTNGGAAFDSDASDYMYAASAIRVDGTFTASVISAGAAQIALGRTDGGGTGVGSAATKGATFSIEIMNPTSSTVHARLQYDGHYKDDNGTPYIWRVAGVGARLATQDIDAIRILFSTGNLSAAWRLIGIR